MKKNQGLYRGFSLSIILLLVFIANIAMAETGISQVAPDGDEKKKQTAFVVYAGVSFNDLSGTTDMYESSLNLGYILGASYKRGRFFYWQIGARYDHSIYYLKDSKINEEDASKTEGGFSVSSVHIPITAGLNILSFTDRIFGLRVFIGAVPAFALGVGSNDLGITNDNTNGFNLYGQGGLGINIAFVVLEAGYNYGFTDLFQNDIPSNPSQIWVKLGFRF